MPISFDPVSRIFKLDTKSSTYALMVYQENYLVHLHYGPKIPDTDLAHLMYRDWYDSFLPHNPHIDDNRFSLELTPMEYPCANSGDCRIPALEVRSPAGDTVTDLRYVSHRIFPGKPKLEGLPATYAGKEDAETLEIEMSDSVTDLRVFLLYTVFENYSAMARSVRIENQGDAPVELERAFSLCLDLPTMDYELIYTYGRWAKENATITRTLMHGDQGVQSRRGMTGHGYNPFAALLRQDASEEYGDAIGINLIYSGNFSVNIQVDAFGCPRVLAGINPDTFRWHMEPGESFTTPEAVTVFSDSGLGGMSREFHRLYTDHLIRSEWAKKKRPLLINSWEAAYFNIDDQLLTEFAREAKELGIEMLVMDDGWFGARNDERHGLGDWQVNTEKLKGGLDSLIQRVNEQGLKFGIWYEPEMVNPDSDLYRAHPDWVIQAQKRESSLSRSQLVLDMTRQDVRDNIFQQMYDLISTHKIDYIKWDCNRNISEAGNAVLPPERQGEFFHRYVLGVYELMDQITTAFPHILLENCSGGGGRFDAGMLYYSPQIWTSDNTDPLDRLAIQFGASLCYPTSSMGAHVSANPRTSYETKAAVAMMGTFGYELDPRKLTNEKKKLIKMQIADYHKYYNLTHYGDFYRITYPTKDRFFCDWEFVSPDKNEVLFTRIIMRRPDNFYQMLRLRGLDPDKMYTDQETGKTYSGAMLMSVGVTLSEIWYRSADGGNIVKHFIAD